MPIQRGEPTKTILMLVFVSTVMLWLCYGWMSFTGLWPANRRNVSQVRVATPHDVARVRNVALFMTGVSAVILFLMRPRDPNL